MTNPKPSTEEQVIKWRIARIICPQVQLPNCERGCNGCPEWERLEEQIPKILSEIRELERKAIVPKEKQRMIERTRDEQWIGRLGEVGFCAAIPDDIPQAVKADRRAAMEGVIDTAIERLKGLVVVVKGDAPITDASNAGIDECIINLEALKSSLLEGKPNKEEGR